MKLMKYTPPPPPPKAPLPGPTPRSGMVVAMNKRQRVSRMKDRRSERGGASNHVREYLTDV